MICKNGVSILAQVCRMHRYLYVEVYSHAVDIGLMCLCSLSAFFRELVQAFKRMFSVYVSIGM